MERDTYWGFNNMDTMELLTKLQQTEVRYEAIYSADAHIVEGYEISGVLEGADINAFLCDEDVPIEYRIELEQLIMEKALQQFQEQRLSVDLYIPVNPNLFMADFGESYFALIQKYVGEERLNHIVLMMAEHDYGDDIEQLHHAVRYLKTYGVKLCLCNISSETHLDYVLLLKPNILKIDVTMLDYNSWGANNDLFMTISALALRIGSSLLFHNIETIYHMQSAWKNGGRYYSGRYLTSPAATLAVADELQQRLHDESVRFIQAEKKLLKQRFEAMCTLRQELTAIVERCQPKADDEPSLLKLAHALTDYSFRIYITDEDGFQQSPNIMRYHDEWLVLENAKHKNWSWRPYFLMNIIQLRHEKTGELSDVYRDIETGDMTRTFSIELPNHHYLFVDITYDYLYEHKITK